MRGERHDNLIYLKTRYALTLGAGVISMILCFWMITEGTGTLLRHHGFDAFYDGQAESMIHGHWDVSPEAIMGEAFVLRGKYYGYFGFTPALPRILLNWLFPTEYGRWTRLLMLFWIACVMAAVFAFIKEFEVAVSPLFLLIAVLGSTLFYLTAYSLVYHEAIMTGAALALWAYLFFCRYLREPRIGFLAAGCVFAFLSFFARLTVGAGPLIAASFVCVALLIRSCAKSPVPFLDWLKFPSPANAVKHAALLAVCIGMTASTYVSVNHAKFGTWLNPTPYEFNVQYDAARLARIHGSLTHLSNIPFDFGAYFGPGRMHFERSFPWFGFNTSRPAPGSAAMIDLVESYNSIPDAMPALAILSVIGIAFAVKGRHRAVLPIIAAALAAGCLMLTFSALTFRYVHDFYPFLLISAILGVGAVQSKAAKALIAVAGVWSIAACFALTLRAQRQDIWPEAAPQAAFEQMRGRVNSLLPFGSVEPIRYNIGDRLKYFRRGQLLTVVDPPATYLYDGQRWQYVTGVPLHRFDLLVKFPNCQANTHMPLWFGGRSGASDAVFIIYVTATQVEFCSDHWGGGGTCGPPVEIQPGREYHLHIDADRLNFHLAVLLDGRQVFDTPMQFHPWKDQDILLGKSLVPSTYGADFTGEIKRDEP